MSLFISGLCGTWRDEEGLGYRLFLIENDPFFRSRIRLSRGVFCRFGLRSPYTGTGTGGLPTVLNHQDFRKSVGDMTMQPKRADVYIQIRIL